MANTNMLTTTKAAIAEIKTIRKLRLYASMTVVLLFSYSSEISCEILIPQRRIKGNTNLGTGVWDRDQ